MPEDLVNGVSAPAEGGAAPAQNSVENVTSTVGQSVVKSADVEIVNKKLEEQVGNLNIALRQTREENAKVIKNLEEQLAANKGVTDKLASVFAPPTANVEPEKTGLTEDALLRILDEREAQKVNAEKIDKRKQLIATEVSTLEKEWDGKDGRPVYNDSEVWKWQQDNDKTNLTPKAAFLEMKINDILDWNKKTPSSPAPVVVTPGSGGARVEGEGEVPTYANPAERRSAVAAAIQAAMAN